MAALFVGGTVTGFGVAAPAAATCDVAASKARLADARHLVTALRLGQTTDPRRAALARDLRAMGITPAISTGWRQQAVDVSDHLRGTTDPTLARVAVALARNGVGPTPADLAQDDPGPLEELLNTATPGGTVVIGAVDAAGQALSALPTAPVAAPADPPRASAGRAPHLRTDTPRACGQPDGHGIGDTTSTPDPDASAAPDPSMSTSPSPPTMTGRSSPAPYPLATSAPSTISTSDSADPSSGSAAPDFPDRSSTPSLATPGSSETGFPSPDPSGNNPGELRRAADIVQAVADLLRSLSGQSSPDARQLAEQLKRLLPQTAGSGAGPSTTDPPDSTLPDSTAVDPAAPDMTSSASTSASGAAQPTVSVDPSSGSDGDQPRAIPDGWESQASELADQARQAAPGDPLARDLASKLDAAGFGDGSGANNSTDDSGAATATSTPAPSTPDSAGSSRADPSTMNPSTSDSSIPESSTSGSSTPATSRPDVTDSARPDADAGEPGSVSGVVSPATWDRLADCESSGDWAADNGNGYAGGLQFAPATWQAFGGEGSPSDASRSEQMAVAQQVKDAEGWSAWPACSTKLGLR